MPVFLRWLLRFGPTNPIAVRLVQNGSRRPRHMYIRSAYLAVLIVVLLWTLLLGASGGTVTFRQLAAQGAESFTWIAYLQILLICVLSPVFMAGAIAQEASPRTWEILLTTPLSPLQIVLGNLLGRLFFILALLVASMPLFALTQFFGGVPGRSIMTSYLIAGCAALLVGSIAIGLAVSRLVGRRAVFAFYVSVVSYLAITAAIDRMQGGGTRVTWMTGMNPFLALYALLNPATYQAAPPGSHTGLSAVFLQTPVKAWCWGSLLLSLVIMGVSTLTVRSGGLQGIGSQSGGVPLHRRLMGLGRAGAEHRPPRSVWHNPIAWREAAARNGTPGRIAARWAFVSLGAIFGVWLIYTYHTTGFSHSEFRLAMMATVWGELAVISLVAINMAATAVSREREDGTLDILLTTPLTAGQYLAGKLRGLIAYLLPMLAVPLGTLALAGFYVLTGGLGREGGVVFPQGPFTPPTPGPVLLPESALIAPVVVLPFIAFCVMVGLQWSLKSKGTIGSVVATVGVVGTISGIIGLCGWKSATGINYIGPVLGALSPASLVYALIHPVDAMYGTVQTDPNSGLMSARIALAIGAVISATVYAAAVYGIHANMVRTFDMTVRKLAGVK